MRRPLLRILAALLIFFAAGFLAQASLRTGLHKNHERLLQQGYSTTLGFFHRMPRREPISLRFLASSGGEIEVDVTHRALFGKGRIEIRRDDGSAGPVFSAAGRSFARRRSLHLAPGRYAVAVDFRHAWFGGLDLGMRGPLTWVRDLDPRVYTRVDSAGEDGFHWPCYLYVPPNLADRPELLVVPNNTGHCDDDLEVHEEAAKTEILRDSRMARDLGVPLLVPVFPRSEADSSIYTHALDRDVLECGRSDIGRLDLQLAAMADHARALLKARGVAVGEKLLLFGFSASGMFVNRFTILHPDRVLAVACGSPGGWPIAPVAEVAGRPLRYPVGIADLGTLAGEEVDLEALRRVPMFFFLGGEDHNDSVVFRDGYDEEDERLVFELFGSTLQERWKMAEALYDSAGLDARFALYPSAGHEVTEAMAKDVRDFFRAHLH
jgi:predicted esterase